VKAQMGRRAASLVEDGMVVMLDGSTSAYHIVPYLAERRDLIVVTSGAKTAVALAEANIPTFCTGGQMLIHSFSYVGAQTKRFLNDINADILFFSARGISYDGRISDQSVEEADVRREMFCHAKKKYFLCDSSKFGKSYFYNLCNISDIDGILSDQPFEAMGDLST
jgi:DeoR/GlpR family transcriptional regulator of sugar metabolism